MERYLLSSFVRPLAFVAIDLIVFILILHQLSVI